ncbi:MAG: VanZ family protein [Sarcina sp.]
MSNNERFNNFWVITFSVLVGYLANYFVGSYLLNDFLPESNLKDIFSIFLMISFMVFIYLILNFLLEKELTAFFYYVLWFYYFVLIFILNFGLERDINGFNLNPFKTMDKSFFDFLIFILKNLVLFIPIGFLLRGEDIFRSLVIVLLFEISLELAQYVLKVGIFDINEMFFNVIGIYLGYFAFKKQKKKRKYNKRRKKATIDG